jgi:hypothetical protein
VGEKILFDERIQIVKRKYTLRYQHSLQIGVPHIWTGSVVLAILESDVRLRSMSKS